MAHPTPKISIVANTWIKQMHFAKAGDINPGHKHTFDHQTLLGKGKIKVHVADKTSEFTAPAIIFIRAGYEHTIEAIEDDTVCYCIHAIRDGERIEDIVDPADIPHDGILETPMTEDGHVMGCKPTPMSYLE